MRFHKTFPPVNLLLTCLMKGWAGFSTVCPSVRTVWLCVISAKVSRQCLLWGWLRHDSSSSEALWRKNMRRQNVAAFAWLRVHSDVFRLFRWRDGIWSWLYLSRAQCSCNLGVMYVDLTWCCSLCKCDLAELTVSREIKDSAHRPLSPETHFPETAAVLVLTPRPTRGSNGIYVFCFIVSAKHCGW